MPKYAFLGRFSLHGMSSWFWHQKKKIDTYALSVLPILYVNPGSRSLIFIHPGSLIQQQNQKRRWENFFSYQFLIFFAKTLRIIDLFTQKFVISYRYLKYGLEIRFPRFGMPEKPIRIQGQKGRHRIPDPDPQHCTLCIEGSLLHDTGGSFGFCNHIIFFVQAEERIDIYRDRLDKVSSCLCPLILHFPFCSEIWIISECYNLQSCGPGLIETESRYGSGSSISSESGSGYWSWSNPDPEFCWQNTEEKTYSRNFFYLLIGSKIAIYLCPSYRRRLQPSKVNIQHFKK